MDSQISQPPQPSQPPHSFQVDLRGLVDLLSHHLYSSPRVYLRELLQNAVDAVTARRALHPDAPARVRLHAADGALRVEDTGIGLTESDVHDLLATIGRSSKRAEGLQEARSGFLGQFGIGLLACFVVAERIRVVSRSARTPDAPPVEWTARDDGSYTVRALPAAERPEPGTTVYLTARSGAAEWLAPERVRALARDFGSLLPYDVRVDGEPVTDLPAPWDRPYPGPAARRVALARHCHELFGFTPLDAIGLDLPVAGIRGVAYVLPSAVSPAQRATHRVHLKGMLLTERAEQLLPDWAFFVRCVLDTDSLRPTASRESLYEDETLAAVREALGERIRSWLTGLAAGDPERLGAFLAVHHLGVKSLARHDSGMLRTMLPWLPFETTDGQLSLEEFARRHPVVHFTRTVEEYRQVAPIASAQGVGVVNGGYTYDTELIEALPRVRPGTVVAELDADTVTAHLDAVEAAEELALSGFLAAARARLDPLGCDVVLRAFHPLSVPALHLDDRAARHEQARADAEERADDLWAGILGSLRGSAPRAAGAQPPEPAGPADRGTAGPGADRHRHGVAVRAGAADGAASAAAGRLGAAEPGVHRPAGVGHAWGERSLMGEITDVDALRRALAENAGQPEGPARNARAEQLLAEAELLAVPLAVVEALGHQLKVYNYSSEKDRMFVPFARLLRLWDERPEDFDAYETHSLHWVFKWMSAGMLDQPHVPLASVEKWLGEMEHRYRLAGHSERAVRAAEFSVASHVGDRARAERAYTAWLAADRDAMADCHACELRAQGAWQAECGRDAKALELWAPVLEGAYTCAHEPHTVLASSLAPLLRLGRAEEARAHHLRGFRLVRPMESMRGAYADHVEFCALTGNEARGLELLAERPAYFTDTGQPRSRLEFLAAVTLLTDRLCALGLGGQPVPGPAGRTWTARELADHARGEATELAGRFDRRNGTSHLGDRTRARVAQRPLVERLPLGVRSVRPAPPPPAPSVPETSEAPGLAALLAEARRQSDTLRPNALEAWAAVARAARDTELEPRDRAEIADHEAMARGPEGVALFERAAVLYAAAGDPGEALAARARGAYVRALGGEVDAALAAIGGLYDEVLALYADEATGVRQTASVVISRARILMRRVHQDTAGPAARAALAAAERAVREVLALVEGRTGDEIRLAARAAEAHGMLAELAGLAGDTARAAELFERSARAYVAAGLPWFAVEYEVQVAALAHQAGDAAGAERALRAALEHGGPYVEPVGRAQLHLQLAEVIGARGEAGEAARHALEAAHWADEAGEGPTLGAWARQQLGGLLLRQGRYAEGAEVLESALADLSAGTHGDGAVVQARWWLGDCLDELGEHREAAEQRLRAADLARHWPEQQDHATLAHLAAESLGRAGLTEEADRAYARAGELWRALGNQRFLVRALRARAWLALDGESGADAARHLMSDAVHACEEARRDAADRVTREELTAELAHTHRQFGDLLIRSATEAPESEPDRDAAEVSEAGPDRDASEAALTQLDRAAELFAALGAEGLHDRTGAELAAGRLAADLGRPTEAAARARAVLAAYDAAGDGEEPAGARRAEATRLLRAAETGEPG